MNIKGKGQFGDVHLVQYNKNKKNFAIKVISKKVIQELNLQKHIEVNNKTNEQFKRILYVKQARENCIRSRGFPVYSEIFEKL